ncbi:MAG: hypothetical protein GEV12_21680 [Micromonosporaceae bacterium]|nr:hypothetical protein [Micromonosporaceae bacterium]
MNQQRQQQRVPSPTGARRRASRRGARLLAVGLALLLACTRPADDDPAPAEPGEETPTAAAEQSEGQTENPAEEALDAYEQYLGALTLALGGADPDDALDEHATGSGLETAREQLRANEADGLIATGTLQPSIDASQVTVDGDEATLTDCILNDLAQVRADNPDEIVEPASGNRQPLTVTLTRAGDAWKASRTTGPALRGPVPEGESCAPPALEQEVLDQYEAYWDTFYAAGDPGNEQPANPEDPALTGTEIDPQLGDTRAFLTRLRDAGQVLRGRPDTSATILGVLDYDQLAVLTDCVLTVEGAGIYDATTGQLVESADPGTRTLLTTEMRPADGSWKVSNSRVEEAECERSSE